MSPELNAPRGFVRGVDPRERIHPTYPFCLADRFRVKWVPAEPSESLQINLDSGTRFVPWGGEASPLLVRLMRGTEIETHVLASGYLRA